MLFHVSSLYAGTPQALTSSFKTVLSGVAQTASLRRGKVVELSVGPISDPGSTDCNIIYTVLRQTANDGTKTSVTPNYYEAIEAGTPPSPGSAWNANFTAEPTVPAGSSLWDKALNQHSGFLWYAPDDIGMPWPAVNVNGLAFQAKGASGSFTGTVMYEAKFQE